jgi:asparagine synthase (glutamine-hydrolysing)
MCGIAGIIDPTGRDTYDKLLNIGKAMTSRLVHRGPDSSGIWGDESSGVVLGHRRLSIIDLSGGAQPMVSVSGRYVLSFNGELYNFQSLRAALARDGINFRDNSDTEVFLAAITKWPIEKALSMTVGMFAFALWDKEEKRLLLGRDRMGEKPLYYGWIENRFVFASELKAFQEVPQWGREIDRDALSLFFRHNYVPDPYSIFQNIYKLPAASYLSVDERYLRAKRHAYSHLGVNEESSDSTPKKYWAVNSLPGIDAVPSQVDSEQIVDLQELLRSTIKNKMLSDVPLGALLSGGVDSSLVAALMQEASTSPIDTFTIGFDSEQHNEARFAKEVAMHLGTNHEEMVVTGLDALSVIPELPEIYDEPFADSSQIPTILISRLARKSIKVALSGDGGDELFGGYNRYTWGKRLFGLRSFTPLAIQRCLASMAHVLTPEQWNRFGERANTIFGKGISTTMFGDKLYKATSLLGDKDFLESYKALISFWHSPEHLVFGANEPDRNSDFKEFIKYQRTSIEKMMLLDMATYLPGDILVKVDRASMSAGLEVRAPLLDHRIVEFSSRLPLNMKVRGGVGKWLLRQVLYQYVPRPLVDRPKMGFGVPLGSWLRGPLREWAAELLNDQFLREQGILNTDLVQTKWEEHISGQRNWEHQLWGVLMFQSWLKHHS